MSWLKRGRHYNPHNPHQQEESLLRPLNFVAKSQIVSYEPRGYDWKAGALPTELPPQIRSYFSPKNQLCQRGSTCFVKNGATELANLIGGYELERSVAGQDIEQASISCLGSQLSRLSLSWG